MAGKPSPSTQYPDDQELQTFVRRRRQRGLIWRLVIQLSTIVGILALTALLYNIVISAFGFVAIQNKMDPGALVLALQEERMLSSQRLLASEDDEVLAGGVAIRDNAIGFFGYAYYQEHANELRALNVAGVTPNPETVSSGEYPLSRPLYIYTSADILQSKPQVAAFVAYYLARVQAEIEDVGYFPMSEQAQVEAQATLAAVVDPAPAPGAARGDIAIAGSSTVYPLTQRLAETFQAAGYTGEISVESIGSRAGLQRFCAADGIDIANASRAINRSELELCRQNGREPLELRVGTDAIAVVVGQENDFAYDVSFEQLRDLFTTAEHWVNVNPDWPDRPILRFIPGSDSGTLDFFVETVFDQTLAELPKETLVSILEANISAGLMRRFEAEKSFFDRTQEEIYQLVLARVVEPKIVATWSLTDSIFNRHAIEAEVATIPNAELVFRSWLTSDFVSSPQSSQPEIAGVRTAILGSLWVILITILFSIPIGVGAAIYLEEYGNDRWFDRIVETNINNLAGVPSIIYGMLGLAIFVRLLETLTSGTLFGATDPTTANGRTVISAGLTLGLLILPIIIINGREAIRAVPRAFREASYGLGATKWQTIWNHVLPSAMPGILTGAILAISRAIGETAPLVVIGASTFIVVDPSGPFAKFTTLPIQIYQWTSRPQEEFRNLAAAAIIVLLILLLTLNASAILLRNRFARSY